MNEMIKRPAASAAESGRLHVEGLLARYPSITEGERETILGFLNESSALDTALLTCNETIADNLKAFRQDHRKQLGFTPINWMILITILGLVAFAVYYMWDAGT